jgi:hypothetical protein
MTDTTKYEYDAFISYRHVRRDRAWAKWLVESLETYRTPKSLRAKGVPARLSRVFRDEDELPTSADLSDAIKTALAASRCLIVVCSSDTPSSLWVAREIAMFREMGRGDRIVALLVEGEPATSFPLGLTQAGVRKLGADGAAVETVEAREPLAADVRPREDESLRHLKAMARLRILALLFGCSFDELRQRDRERRRKRRLTLASLVTAVLAAAGIAGVWSWDHGRLKVKYFKHVTYRHLSPVGVGELSDAEHSHREASARFEYRRGLVERTAWVSSADVVVGEEPCEDQRIEYRANRTLARWVCRDRAGKVTGTSELLADKPIIEFRDRFGNLAPQKTTAPGETEARASSQLVRERYELDERGFAVRSWYQDPWGAPVTDRHGSYGRLYKYSKEGLVVETQEMDAQGGPMALRNGVSGWRSSFDGKLNLVSTVYIDGAGHPITHPDLGFAEKVFEYDDWGNRRRHLYRDDRGDPAVRDEEGLSALEFVFNDRGNPVEMRGFDTAGSRAIGKNGTSGWRQTFDKNGRVVSFVWTDVNGSRTTPKEGVAKRKLVYDQKGNLVGESYHDEAGRPTTEGRTRIASRRWEFGPAGDVTQASLHAVDGSPVLGEDGWATARYAYDQAGNLVLEQYLGRDGRPVRTKDGCASTATSYNRQGRPVESRCMGEDGEPAVNPRGFFRQTTTFDDAGRITEETTYGVAGAQVASIDGYARVTTKHDPRGNMLEQAYFAPGGQPALHAKERHARVTWLYDERGNVTEKSFWDESGRLVVNPVAGCARDLREYDAHGNWLRERFLDAQEKPVAPSQLGYASWKGTYESHGKMTLQEFFGPDGELVANPKFGAARFVWRYDDRGNSIETLCFGPDGLPTAWKGKKWSRSVMVRDAQSRIVEMAHYGPEGGLVEDDMLGGAARLVQQVDQQGRVVDLWLYGPNGSLKVIDRGFAGRTARWEGNRLVEQSLYDDQRRLLSGSKCGRQIYAYDGNGRVLEEACYGPDGRLALSLDDHCARHVFRYDSAGNQIERRCFGPDGELLAPDGRPALERKTYDGEGRQISESISGTPGKPATYAQGHSGWRRRFDEEGRVVEQVNLGADGKPMVIRGGYASAQAVYDAGGHLVEISLADEMGRPLAGPNRWTRCKASYDAGGNLVEVAFFDAAGAAVSGEDGYAVARFAYDAEGMVVEASYVGPDGKPARVGPGFARWVVRRDAAGKPQTLEAWEARFVAVEVFAPSGKRMDLTPVPRYRYLGLPLKVLKAGVWDSERNLRDVLAGRHGRLVQVVAAAIATSGRLPPGVDWRELVEVGFDGLVDGWELDDGFRESKSDKSAALYARAAMLAYLRHQWIASRAQGGQGAEPAPVDEQLRLLADKPMAAIAELWPAHSKNRSWSAAEAEAKRAAVETVVYGLATASLRSQAVDLSELSIDDELVQGALSRVVKRSSEQDQALVRRIHWEGQSYQEVASSLGISEQAAKAADLDLLQRFAEESRAMLDAEVGEKPPLAKGAAGAAGGRPRGRLGVEHGPVRATGSLRFLGLSRLRGARVSRTLPGSAAALAGVEPFDVIVAIGERSIGNYLDVVSTIEVLSAGATVELHVRRGRRELTLTATLQAPDAGVPDGR